MFFVKFRHGYIFAGGFLEDVGGDLFGAQGGSDANMSFICGH